MANNSTDTPAHGWRGTLQQFLAPIPALGYLLGMLTCVFIEKMAGDGLAGLLGLPKVPILFGLVNIFEIIGGVVNMILKGTPFEASSLLQIPASLAYFVLVYLLPLAIVARLFAKPANQVADGLWDFLERRPLDCNDDRSAADGAC